MTEAGQDHGQVKGLRDGRGCKVTGHKRYESFNFPASKDQEVGCCDTDGNLLSISQLICLINQSMYCVMNAL